MDVQGVERALEGLRAGLRIDGADLIVNSVSTDCVDLSLVLKENACPECIVDSEMLLTKVRLILNKVLPQLPRVVLHDPRTPEHGDA